MCVCVCVHVFLIVTFSYGKFDHDNWCNHKVSEKLLYFYLFFNAFFLLVIYLYVEY